MLKILNNKHLFFIIVLLLVHLIIRIPSFFDPYWYVDETLYLVMGKAIKSGEILYKDIVDNKPPVVYLLATLIDSQVGLRVFMTTIVSLALVAFYDLMNKFFIKNLYISQLFTFILMVLLSSISFEGTIFNAEPVFISFIIVGWWLVSKTVSWQLLFLNSKTISNKQIKLLKNREFFLLFMSGILFGLSLLTKVPAILFFGPIILTLIASLLKQKNNSRLFNRFLIFNLSILFLGIILPIFWSIIYFYLNDALGDYYFWCIKFLFSYVESWEPFFSFSNLFISNLFSTPFKISFLVSTNLFLLLLFFKNKISVQKYLIFTWVSCNFYAVVISNRPFNNYWLPFFPPFMALTALLFDSFFQKKKDIFLFLFYIFSVFLIYLIFFTIPFKLFPYMDYYKINRQWVNGEINSWLHNQWFDFLVDERLSFPATTYMGDNEIVRSWLNKKNVNSIFILGNNPMVLVDTEVKNAIKFPLSFYLDNFFEIHEQIYQQINDSKPDVILIMKDNFSSFTLVNQLVADHYQEVFDLRSQNVYFRKDSIVFKLKPTHYYSRMYLISQILRNDQSLIKSLPDGYLYPRNDTDIYQLEVP